MKKYIVSFKDKTAASAQQTGGKGASLARLLGQGFNVPEGFVITPQAFTDFLWAFGIEVLTQREEWAERDVQRIQEMLTACCLPDELAAPIADAYQQLGGRVAVRSSMVGEDAELASFAGQLDSALNVEGREALLQAVTGCWASLFNWRLWSYLTQREALSPQSLLESFSIAVVVQRMVDAQAAGVAFSADPVTGQPCVIIESVKGLGEALVQGLAEPDRYIVDARGIVIESTLSRQSSASLSDEQAIRLADLVCQVACTMQAPQDVEWAWDGRDFHLLQSRPITSLVGQRVYSNAMVSDMLPGLVKPLTWSISTISVLENIFGRTFTKLIGANDIDFRQLARRVHSRIYADNTMLGQLLERLGLPANFFEVMSRDERAERRQRLPLNRKTLRTMLRLTSFILHHINIANEISTFIERHQGELEAYRCTDWAANSAGELLARANHLIELYSETMWYNFIGQLNMMGRNRMLSRLVQRHAPDVAPGDLVRGLVGLKSLDSNRELQDMAAQARALGDECLHLLTEQDDAAIRTTLSSLPEGQNLIHQVDGFLARYGFLSACGTDLSRTPWIENPNLIWHAIGRAAFGPGRTAAGEVEKIRTEAQAQVRARLNWQQRFSFDRLLKSTITYISLREKSSFLISEESFEMRRVFLALAERLLARGHLGERDDIFYLSLDELDDLVAGRLEARLIREWTAARRAEMKADALIELPPTICGDHVPTRPIALAKDQEYLSGIGGSSGLAHGYARVVLDPTEAPSRLTREDILVVPFTDMSWTPLFPGIGGIVAETGGQLSHSAIVAREYGLPAVVNVKNATQLIVNGRRIEVDGNNGRVYLK